MSHRSTTYPCFLPDLGGFSRSWSHKTYPLQRYDNPKKFLHNANLINFRSKFNGNLPVEFLKFALTKTTHQMEEKYKSIGGASLIDGALLALTLIVLNLLLYLSGLSGNKVLAWLQYLVMLGGIILAQLYYRKNYSGGYLSFGKAFTLGFLTMLFAAIIFAVYNYIFLKYIDPGVLEEAFAKAEQQMEQRGGMSEVEMERALKTMRKFQSPAMAAFSGIFMTVIVGLILSLIGAIFSRKENTEMKMD